MKVKNDIIFMAKPSLEKLIEKELPVKASFALAKLVNRMLPTFAAIENTRNGLIKKYATADPDDPNQFSIPLDTEEHAQFTREFNELMEQEEELVFEMVTLPEMVDGVALTIEPSVLMALEPFVEVE